MSLAHAPITRDQPVIRLGRFAYATVFAFTMALVRFFCATQRS